MKMAQNMGTNKQFGEAVTHMSHRPPHFSRLFMAFHSPFSTHQIPQTIFSGTLDHQLIF